MADASAVGAASISLGQTVVAYQFFLPRLSEVRRADPNDPLLSGDVYLGQVAAGAVSVSVGVMLSALTGSRVPLYTSLFMALVIGGLYHYALRSA